MNYPAKTLYQCLVKPFYQENAGVLTFIFTMMFFVVSQQSGAGLYEYHVMLVTGMLKNPGMLLLVFLLWALYSRKAVAFVSGVMQQPSYSFLQILNSVGRRRQFRLFFVMEVWLMLPVLLYAVFIAVIGYRDHFYIPVSVSILFLLLLCTGAATWHVYQLRNPGKAPLRLAGRWRFSASYPAILLRFVAGQQKVIWTGIKLFTCVLLYCIASNNPLRDFDGKSAFILYSFGILANGVLVYRIRQFEESYAGFYRGMPVALWKRLLQYAVVYFVLLLPEFITAAILVPAHMHVVDAIGFSLCGYSLLLLMNGITFFPGGSRQTFIRLLLLIFCVLYVLLMHTSLVVIYLLAFTLAITFTAIGYYRFERSRQAS